MKIPLSFAELHVPLFLGGKNFGLKLDDKKFLGLDLMYDQAEKELWITHNEKTAIIPTSNVVSMTPRPDTDGGPLPLKSGPLQMPAAMPGKFSSKISAQVSTPTSHVFGEGPGHTGNDAA